MPTDRILTSHRVLITGASGFMGSWLAESLLQQGAYVINLLSQWEPQGRFVQSGLVRRVHNVIGQVEDYALLERLLAEQGVDTVFHLAALFDGLDAGVARGEAFNFAMGGSWTVLDVVRTLQRLLHREDLVPDIHPASHGEIFHQHVSAEKARRLLGWAPRYSLEDGLRETAGWYREYLDPTASPALSEPHEERHAAAS